MEFRVNGNRVNGGESVIGLETTATPQNDPICEPVEMSYQLIPYVEK